MQRRYFGANPAVWSFSCWGVRLDLEPRDRVCDRAKQGRCRSGSQLRAARLFVAFSCLFLFACSEADPAADLPPVPGLETETSIPVAEEPPDQRAPVDSKEPSVDAREVAPAKILGPEAPKTRNLPLEELLRLPESVRRAHADEAESQMESLPQAEEEREDARLRVRVNRQRESAEFHPEGPVTRERTDAGVSVGVGDGARVGGGVHVVKEPDGEMRDPVPTVGVEKRF
jgi:hypothetical protein